MFVLYYQNFPYGYGELATYKTRDQFPDLWYDIIRLENWNPLSNETDQNFHDIVIDLLNNKQYKDDHIIVEYRS